MFFVKSQVSVQNDGRISTITYGLILQSEHTIITDSMRYAIEPFQDRGANIQYGNVLRTFINFERLSLPIPIPEAPKRAGNDSKDIWFIIGQLGTPALLGIAVAGLLGVAVATYRYNRLQLGLSTMLLIVKRGIKGT